MKKKLNKSQKVLYYLVFTMICSLSIWLTTKSIFGIIGLFK